MAKKKTAPSPQRRAIKKTGVAQNATRGAGPVFPGSPPAAPVPPTATNPVFAEAGYINCTDMCPSRV